MARDHARIYLTIWTDDEDFRALPSTAQWLYFRLVTDPGLTFAGTLDWRPAKLAASTADLTAVDVEMLAAYLEDPADHDPYIIVDRDSEEALIRTFIRHDGLMTSPNITVAMLKAHAAIGSTVLRSVVVHQLAALKVDEPDLRGWAKVPPGLLRRAKLSPVEAFSQLAPNPSVNPSPNPS